MCAKLESLKSNVGLDPTDGNGDWAAAQCFSRALEGGLHPRNPRNAATCRVCHRTSAKLCCITTGTDVKGNCQSTGAEDDAYPLIKLQQYDSLGRLDTFLTTFQRMARYLRWDDEDMFHYL